jgi:Alw26I/Eco31I/Esp3I family type II restriction m6 adenine DNA methyltransferase
LTNPPWIVLKPDVRDIKNISESKYQDYTKSLYSYSKQIETLYPISKPNNGWSGWGINLSRTGIEVAVSLMSKDGITGVVSPASLLADINSKKFREWLFIKHNCSYINYYPAECRLFKEVDQPSICMGITNSSTNKICSLIAYDKNLKRKHTTKINLNSDFFNQTGSVIPINLDQNQIDIFRTFSKFDLISKLEGKKPGELWIGRELDETGYVKRITPDGNIPFVKGRGIHRLDSDIVITGKMSEKTIGKIIPSIKFPRIVWRDVSRPTQKRRIQATLLPTGYLTGNSLGVMHFYENNQENLFTYLGLFSSIVFEFQIRAMLATGHISASTIKNAHIPNLSKEPRKTLSYLTQRILDKDKNAERELEIYVAKLYGLDKKQFKSILKLFTKINKNEQEELLDSKIWMNM